MKKYKIYLILLVIFSFTYVVAQFDYITILPGADPSVSAEDGGNRFEEIAESLGYQTANFTVEDLKYFGDQKAVKGGTLRDQATRYPATLRTFGKESNYVENTTIASLCYEPLLERHPLTFEPTVPRLASHWKISDFVLTLMPDGQMDDV